MTPGGDSARGETFERHRPRLFALAYRMLGVRADAEDVVQEAAVRWARTDAEARNPEAFLVRVTTRLAIDALRRARVERERYVGPWLPEPLVAPERERPDAVAELADSLSVALLVVLETLAPHERAAYLLREAFGYSYREVGEAVGATEAGARQAVRRARARVGVRRLAPPSPADVDHVVEAFVAAARSGDTAALVAMLDEEATLRSDGGGVVPSALREVVGADRVGRFVAGVFGKLARAGVNVELATVGGVLGVRHREGERTVAVWSFDVTPEARVRAVYVVVNPEKLGGA